MGGLCEFPPEQDATCCAAPPPPPAAPVRPFNPPRLTRLDYRIGTFTTFRQALVDDLAVWLPRWRGTLGSDDYATMLVELWAYVADVLSFYQERIANEAFLGTATQRDSLARLVELINYRPSPGAAASALLAFSLAKGKTLNIPAGLRTGSKPTGGRPPATFQTDAAIVALADHNEIAVANLATANQFARLEAIQNVLRDRLRPLRNGLDYTQLRADLEEVFPQLGDRVFNSTGLQFASATTPAAPRSGGAVHEPMSRTVVFQGTNLRLQPGDYLMIFDAPPAHPLGDGELREIISVVEDRAAKTTAVTWLEHRGYLYARPDPQVLVFRARASVFGYNAPLFTSLSPYLTQTRVAGFPNVPVYTSSWEFSYLPETTDAHILFLDRVYKNLVPSTQGAPSWVVLLDTSTPDRTHQALRLTAADQVTHSAFTLTAQVTRLTLESAVWARTFNMRTTSVLIQSEVLPLFNLRPLPERLGGATVLLAGRYPGLTVGQTIVISGRRYDRTTGKAGAETAAEDALIDDLQSELGDQAAGLTALTLHEPLSAPDGYARSTTRVKANIAPASHGETVRDEILGSGDGSPFQALQLKKSPLTYVQATTAANGAVQTTLQLTISGVRWSERPNFVEAGAGDRVYVTNQDVALKTTVQFGDGTNGARPPTGKDNIHARYRHGIGVSGQLPADAITQLIDSVPGLQAVTNPEPTSGAADPETSAQLRSNAPASLRTFGRAVSLEDYAAQALTFPGVSMARAAWMRRDAGGHVLPRPVITITIATSNGMPLAAQPAYAARLRRFLDTSRDVNVPMRLVDFLAVYVDVAAAIDVEDDHGRHATLKAAQEAMTPGRNPDGTVGFFARFGFGEAVHLSGVYAALQTVPGVRDATITVFRQPDVDPSGTVRNHIFVPASGLAVVGNDPADVDNHKGKLDIALGLGGFAD